MRRRSLVTPLLALLVLTFALVVATIVWSGAGQRYVSKRGLRLAHAHQQTTELNQNLRQSSRKELDAVRGFLVTGETSDLEEFDRLVHLIGRTQIRYLSLDIAPEERRLVTRIRELQANVALFGEMALESARSGKTGRARQFLSQMQAAQEDLEETLDLLDGLQGGKVIESWTELVESVHRGDALLLPLALVLLATLTGIWFHLQNRVRRPLAVILRTAERVGQGDLDARAPIDRPDEIGQLAGQFNTMTARLVDSHSRLEQRVVERTREIQALQGELIHAEKLSAVGRLVSGVAHELNNPLTVLRGMAELGIDQPEDTPELLAGILRQTERCERIVEGLLEFGGQRPARRTPIDLSKTVAEALGFLHLDRERNPVRLETRLDEELPVLVADPFKIQQVVVILMKNALDALAEVDRPGVIVVSTAQSGNDLLLEVRDDGPGMRDPERVFEPFYTTRQQRMGTGLGLSVCHGIVSEHGGDITADNLEPGARFKVRFPLRPRPEEES